ncbi:MAG: hypothetical protein LBG17_04735 [Bacteroidales bacterium]|jgi:hypothetical protein|nr:hypothetical protein [Bacteroidales bacterium]
MITIYNILNGLPLIGVQPLDDSRFVSAINEPDRYEVDFITDVFYSNLGTRMSFIMMRGKRYYGYATPQIIKRHTHCYEWRCVFYAPIKAFDAFMARDVDPTTSSDSKIVFSLTANIKGFAQFIVDNINWSMPQDGLQAIPFTSWHASDVDDANEKTIDFDGNTILEAVQMIADAFELEWECAQTELRFWKILRNESDSLSLAYGKGNGLRGGIDVRFNEDYANILFVKGGDRNIIYDADINPDTTLLLPYAGSAHTYKKRRFYVNNDRRSIRLFNHPYTAGTYQKAVSFDDIYPSWYGTVKGTNNEFSVTTTTHWLKTEYASMMANPSGFHGVDVNNIPAKIGYVVGDGSDWASSTNIILSIDRENERFIIKGGQITPEDFVNQFYGVNGDRAKVYLAFDKDIFMYPWDNQWNVRVIGIGTETHTNNSAFYFWDDAIDFNLLDYIIPGENLRVVFESGVLIGKEFAIRYTHNGRKFEMVRQTIDDVPMPNETFKPVVGDRYGIYGMTMPTKYVELAQQRLFERACAELYDRIFNKINITVEIDPLWFRDYEAALPNRDDSKLVVGGMVEIMDEELNAYNDNRVATKRIVSIERNINNDNIISVNLDGNRSFLQQYNKDIKILNNTVSASTQRIWVRIMQDRAIAENNK